MQPYQNNKILFNNVYILMCDNMFIDHLSLSLSPTISQLIVKLFRLQKDQLPSLRYKKEKKNRET